MTAYDRAGFGEGCGGEEGTGGGLLLPVSPGLGERSDRGNDEGPGEPNQSAHQVSNHLLFCRFTPRIVLSGT